MQDLAPLRAPLVLTPASGTASGSHWYQLVKFCVVGRSGYVVSLCVFAVCVSLFSMHHLVAATCAFVVAVANNFLVEPSLDLRRR